MVNFTFLKDCGNLGQMAQNFGVSKNKAGTSARTNYRSRRRRWGVCCHVSLAVPPLVVLVCSHRYFHLTWSMFNDVVDATCSMCGRSAACTKSTATRGIYVVQFLLVSVVAYLFSNYAWKWLEEVPGIIVANRI
jgi:hypothetical protein